MSAPEPARTTRPTTTETITETLISAATITKTTITATEPCLVPPHWALAQRSLFALLDSGWRMFADSYTRPDGSLRYDGVLTTRDGADDFFEPFFNWPQLYLLGGADDLLTHSTRHWHGVVAQLTELGMLHEEFEIGYDWFHQGESLLFFYFLTMCEPDRWRTRAVRFADLYVEPERGNYDSRLRIVKAAHNGSGGARGGLSDDGVYPWLAHEAAQYGYPLDWLLADGAQVPEPAQDPRLAEQMHERLGQGDAVGNLSIAGLVLNAYLATGDTRYATWLADYVGGWRERAQANNGLIPDNVGLDGVVGSRLDGRWYGGHYGWTWPHGLYSIGQATVVGAICAALGSADDSYLDMVRALLDGVLAQGRYAAFADSDSSIPARWHAHLGPDVDVQTLLVPYRHSDKGWFDWNPMQTSVPIALWHYSADPADAERIDGLRRASGYDWSTVRAFRDKEEAGHEEPWYAYLAGDNPTYPESILGAAHEQVRRRLELLQANAGRPLTEEDIHLWQNVNPVVTEALVQLTWGAPQVVYNGGLAQARVRYYDADRARPGLPPEVAALVSSIRPEATTVTLVNLSPDSAHTVVVQAGAFAEHHIDTVRYADVAAGWTGRDSDYATRPVDVSQEEDVVGGPWMTVVLPAGRQITLTMSLRMRVRRPSYSTPWSEDSGSTLAQA